MSVKSRDSYLLQFPYTAMSSKLHDSRLLKRPPASTIDWAHQSYLETTTTQDLSHDDHRCSSTGPHIFIKDRRRTRTRRVDVSSDTISTPAIGTVDSIYDHGLGIGKESNTTHQTVTIYLNQLNNNKTNQHTAYGPCTVTAADISVIESSSEETSSDQQKDKAGDCASNDSILNAEVINEADINDDDEIYSATTSSTDPNRQNNIFRYYESYQKQQLTANLASVEEQNNACLEHFEEQHTSVEANDTANVAAKKTKKSRFKSTRSCCKFVFTRMLKAAQMPLQVINERFP